jgi:hypothetical protein
MVRRTSTVALGALMISAATAFAGGFTYVADITGRVPTSIAGTVYGNLKPLRWDTRCMPTFRFNNAVDPIPNPLGTPELTVAQAKAIFQRALDSWNNIPTAYVQGTLGADRTNAGLRAFDQINEVTFNSAAAFAGTAGTVVFRLLEETTFTNGQSFDADADSDVSSAITTCADVDSDGDIEFPAGVYPAGTILDMDIVFNVKASNGFRYTDISDPEVLRPLLSPRTFDLEAEMVRQLAIAFGLAPSALPEVNLFSNADEPSTYGNLDFDDAEAQIQRRTLESEDIAALSTLYPEGTAASGPAALQAGDVAFSDVYGIIEGSVVNGALNAPALGTNITAFDADGGKIGPFLAGDMVSSTYAGTARLAVNTTTFANALLPLAEGAVDGKFRLTVPFGTYHINIEPTDGFPATPGAVNTLTNLGAIYVLNLFEEEFWSGNKESATEDEPGSSKTVSVSSSNPLVTGIDIITNKTIRVSNSGGPEMSGFDEAAPGHCYAVRFPITQLMAAEGGRGLKLSMGLPKGSHKDASALTIFQNAWLAYGSVSGTTATIKLKKALEHTSPLLMHFFDYTPWYFDKKDHAKKIFRAFNRGEETDVFLVIQVPTPLDPSFSGTPPIVGLDSRTDPDNVALGASYFSDNGDCSVLTEDPTWNYILALAFSDK